jgi:hypothetical protein
MQVAYTIQSAGELGRGLFAAEDIPRGAMIWKYEEGVSVRVHTKETAVKALEGKSKQEVQDFLGHMYGCDSCPGDGCVVEVASSVRSSTTKCAAPCVSEAALSQVFWVLRLWGGEGGCSIDRRQNCLDPAKRFFLRAGKSPRGSACVVAMSNPSRLDGVPQRALAHSLRIRRKMIEILDDAKLWNHSRTPNTGDHPDDDGDDQSSYALRDIKRGEQLLDDYSDYDIPKWFHKLCTMFEVEYFNEAWE